MSDANEWMMQVDENNARIASLNEQDDRIARLEDLVDFNDRKWTLRFNGMTDLLIQLYEARTPEPAASDAAVSDLDVCTCLHERSSHFRGIQDGVRTGDCMNCMCPEFQLAEPAAPATVDVNECGRCTHTAFSHQPECQHCACPGFVSPVPAAPASAAVSDLDVCTCLHERSSHFRGIQDGVRTEDCMNCKCSKFQLAEPASPASDPVCACGQLVGSPMCDCTKDPASVAVDPVLLAICEAYRTADKANVDTTEVRIRLAQAFSRHMNDSETKTASPSVMRSYGLPS